MCWCVVEHCLTCGRKRTIESYLCDDAEYNVICVEESKISPTSNTLMVPSRNRPAIPRRPSAEPRTVQIDVSNILRNEYTYVDRCARSKCGEVRNSRKFA